MGIEYLVRSENRTAMLFSLRQEQPLDRADLEERLDASRRTVTRILSDLTERGYIRESTAGYRLTTFGAAVADAYRRCKERTDIAAQYRPFLANIDSDTVDFDPEFLSGADLTVATDVRPHAPIDRGMELRRNASWFRLVTPFIEKLSIERFVNRLQDDESVEFEIIIPARFYEKVQSQQGYGELFLTAAAAASGQLRIYPGTVSILYALVDEVAALGTSVDGKPHAVVESTNPELREWVSARIDEFREESIPIEEYSR